VASTLETQDTCRTRHMTHVTHQDLLHFWQVHGLDLLLEDTTQQNTHFDGLKQQSKHSLLYLLYLYLFLFYRVRTERICF